MTDNWLEHLKQAYSGLNNHREELEEVMIDLKRAIRGVEKLKLHKLQGLVEEEHHAKPKGLLPAPEATPETSPVSALLNTKAKILEYIKRSGEEVSREDVIMELGLSPGQASTNLKSLVAMKVVKRVGRGKYKAVAGPPGLTKKTSRKKEASSTSALGMTQKEFIRRFAEERGSFTVQDLREVLAGKVAQSSLETSIYVPIARLVEEGVLRKTGSGQWEKVK